MIGRRDVLQLLAGATIARLAKEAPEEIPLAKHCQRALENVED